MDGSNEVYLLDTTAFFTGIYMSLPKCYTTYDVIDEVKDYQSRNLLDLSISAGKVIIMNSSQRMKEIVLNKAKEIKESGLSRADISIVALSLEFKFKKIKPILFTDDKAVQRLCNSLGVKYNGIRFAKKI
jgi:rRNA maturation endonuclease Nob1